MAVELTFLGPREVGPRHSTGRRRSRLRGGTPSVRRDRRVRGRFRAVSADATSRGSRARPWRSAVGAITNPL